MVTPAFPPFVGGGERYARSLALALTALGHRITVVTSDARSEQDFWQGRAERQHTRTVQEGPLRVIRCPVRGLPGGRSTLLGWRKFMVVLSALPGERSSQLARLARFVPPVAGLEPALQGVERPDAVLAFNLSWEYPALLAHRYARQNSVPFVMVPFAHFGEGRKTRMARNNTMDHQRRLLSDAERVLTLTDAEVAGLAIWNMDAGHAVVVGAGIDALPPALDPEPLLERHRLSSPLALFIGRVNYDKGAVHAAEAVLRLNEQGQAITLALVGRLAPDFCRFYGQLTPLQRESIRTLGVVGEAEKHGLLEAAQLLLLPSRTDSFGIVLLEAWAHGKPVVGARVGGVGSLVDNNVDGFLVPFGAVPALAEAVQKILGDPAKAAEMGAHGRAKVYRDYTWERVAERVAGVIAELVPDSRSAGRHAVVPAPSSGPD